MELITWYLIGASLWFFILYTREVHKNIKLERENKKLKSDEHRQSLIKKIEEKNKRIALLCSKVQSRDKIISKLKII